MNQPIAKLRYVRKLRAITAAIFFCFMVACSPRQASLDNVSGATAQNEVATSIVSNKKTRYRLVEASPVSTDVPSGAEPLVLRGRGTSGRVLDRDGNVVIVANGGSIYGLQLSPSHDRALVYFGDADYQVIDSRSHAILAVPPPRPEVVDHATGFGWHFLGNDHLVGDAELPSRADTTGMTAAEVEALPPYVTLLYVYELESGTLTRVDIDNALPSIFSIHQVSGWELTLLTYDSKLVGARIVSGPFDRDIDPP